MSDFVDHTPESLDRHARLAQGGDHEAFVALIEATERDLRIFVTCYATSLGMVDEVVQGTYVTAFQSLERYECRGTLRSWLKGIARHLLLRELHQRTRSQPMAGDQLEEILAANGIRELGPDQDPEAEPRPEESVERLRACLDKLAPEARRLIQERYYQDLPVQAIAQLLERSANWVAVSLFRIRKNLLTCMRSGVLASGGGHD